MFDACIDKIEFLGSHCHVHVSADALAAHPLTVYLSLNFLSEQSLSRGSTVRLKLLPGAPAGLLMSARCLPLSCRHAHASA